MLHTFKIAFIIVMLAAYSTGTFGQAKADSKPWKKRVVRILTLDPVDSIKHHLVRDTPDTTLIEIIDDRVMSGRLNIYDSTGDPVIFTSILPRPDTQSLIDPVSREEVQVVIKHGLWYKYVPQYKIVEDWTFDRITGHTTVKIAYVAPMIADYDYYHHLIGYNYPFYLKFDDIANILNRYEAAHPNTDLAHVLWNDYFLLDVKPVKAKQN